MSRAREILLAGTLSVGLLGGAGVIDLIATNVQAEKLIACDNLSREQTITAECIAEMNHDYSGIESGAQRASFVGFVGLIGSGLVAIGEVMDSRKEETEEE
jgi:hypothetical protein